MKTFRNLFIKGNNPQQLKEVLASIINRLNGNWKFMYELSLDYAQNVSKDISEVGCFESPLIINNIARVWLIIWGNDLKITNIVPTKTRSLSFDEYNAFVEAFFNDCVKEVTSEYKVDVVMTKGNYDIEKIAGSETFMALNKWEKSCNHDTGNTHPMDFERWADFITTAYRTKSKLTTDLFKRWLTEERHWDENDDVTYRLVTDFEYGLGLLKYHEQSS